MNTKEDYDYLPATEVCKKKLNIEYKDKEGISYDGFFNDNIKNDNCYQCPINIKIEDCLKSTNKKKYKWE